MAKKRVEYRVMTKTGNLVRTETRAHDGQWLVTVYNEDDMLALEPVDSEVEMQQWFWYYIELYGGHPDE